MDDLGRWMRRVLDEVARPVDPRRIVESVAPPGRRRWPIAVGAAAVVVLLVGGGYWLFAGEPSTEVADDTTTTTEQVGAVTTVVDSMPVVRLNPVRITCTTELPAYPCANLIDGDPTTDWQAPNGGIGSKFTIYFADPVTITDVQLENIVDDTRFRRNARIREVAVSAGQPPVVIRHELADTNDEPGGFGGGLWEGVTSLAIEVTSAYPGQSVGELAPFAELALAEIAVSGHAASVTPTTRAPTAVSPITGTWHRTNPDLGGLLVQVRDLIWDGDAFYLLLRVGFGDLIVYQSADGLEWQEYSRLGTAGTVDGPWHLASLGGRLVVGGGREAVAMVWVEGEGDGSWHEVTVAPSGAIQALTVEDGRLVAFGTVPGRDESRPEGTPPEAHARIWVSDNAFLWTEVAGDEVFGSGTRSLSLLRGESGLLAIGADRDMTRGSGRLVVASSSDGLVWETQEVTGLGAWQVDAVGGGGDGGYLVMDGFSGTGYRSDDGVAWSPAFAALPAAGDEVILSDAEIFRGHLVVSGSVFVDPGGGAFNYMLPGVWVHLGGDSWAPLGAAEWFAQTGTAYRIVTAADRLVVIGEAGSDDWALFTFVVDEP